MFFFLSKTISAFIFPSTWLAILMVWALFSKKKRKLLLWVSFLVLMVYGNLGLANLAISSWEWPPQNLTNLEEHDMAIVLTGVTADTKDSNRVFFARGADRITHAFQLWKLGKVKSILITGGKGGILEKQNELEEALKLRKYLLICGMPDSLIHIETKAKNTYENALFSKNYLNTLPAPPKKIILVTSAFHMRRSLACFKKQGLSTTPFPTDYHGVEKLYEEQYIPVPDAKAMEKFDILIKEISGFLVYKLTRKI